MASIRSWLFFFDGLRFSLESCSTVTLAAHQRRIGCPPWRSLPCSTSAPWWPPSVADRLLHRDGREAVGPRAAGAYVPCPTDRSRCSPPLRARPARDDVLVDGVSLRQSQVLTATCQSRPTSPAMCGGCGGRGCRRAVAEWRIRLLPGRTGRADQARYWMISSARTRIDCGMVNPRALAVLRLRIISNFVGCSIGKSPGFAPFTIRSTYVAARRNRS